MNIKWKIKRNTFREELENNVQTNVEPPSDFASKVISSLDKKVKTTTNKGTKIRGPSDTLFNVIFYAAYQISFKLSFWNIKKKAVCS